MMMRKIILGLGAIAGSVLLLAINSPAEAKRKQCVYMAHNPSGHMMADGWAKSVKLSWACNWAKNRCNRELERKRRQGKAGRGSCVKITNLSD